MTKFSEAFPFAMALLSSHLIAQTCRDFLHGFRRWRRAIKAKMPYVRRRVLRKLATRYDALVEELGAGPRRADNARIVEIKGPQQRITGDLCLFLSFQPGRHIKPHVVAHITSLLDQGVQVVLTINAALTADQIDIEPALLSRLDGFFVRENIGYDFAGWAHAYALLESRIDADRVFLINDSIVGPIDAAAHSKVIERIRASHADMIGLTENHHPRYHLQSFFLVFNRRAIREALGPFFARVMCFKDKQSVIDIYETCLTQHMQREGCTCEALFPTISEIESSGAYYLWYELLTRGFPYIKASVVAENPNHPTIISLVTDRFRAR